MIMDSSSLGNFVRLREFLLVCEYWNDGVHAEGRILHLSTISNRESLGVIINIQEYQKDFSRFIFFIQNMMYSYYIYKGYRRLRRKKSSPRACVFVPTLLVQLHHQRLLISRSKWLFWPYWSMTFLSCCTTVCSYGSDSL